MFLNEMLDEISLQRENKRFIDAFLKWDKAEFRRTAECLWYGEMGRREFCVHYKAREDMLMCYAALHDTYEDLLRGLESDKFLGMFRFSAWRNEKTAKHEKAHSDRMKDYGVLSCYGHAVAVWDRYGFTFARDLVGATRGWSKTDIFEFFLHTLDIPGASGPDREIAGFIRSLVHRTHKSRQQ